MNGLERSRQETEIISVLLDYRRDNDTEAPEDPLTTEEAANRILSVLDSGTLTLNPIGKLTKDLRSIAGKLTPSEARYLTDFYYGIQDYRMRSANQVRALRESGEPNAFVSWTQESMARIESNIKGAMDAYTSSTPTTAWARSIMGIGPILSAALFAHIDPTKATTVGKLWRFAGLDPTCKWKKGQKRPWNAFLKTLCWRIGDSFVKVHNRDGDVYGHIYYERKLIELARNEAGVYAEQAAATLEERTFKDKKVEAVYQSGKLPLGRIELRARRYAVKLFLSAAHEVAYFHHHKTMPPKPYIFSRPEHTHYYGVPNAELIPGLVEAQGARTALADRRV